jgi:glutamate dehydrogenase/leucine dehydrogenase
MPSQHCFSSIQTLKNALSLYKLGGAAGGSDFDPKGKSDNEVFVLYFISCGQ